MLLIVVLWAACQEDIDIPRREKQEYYEARPDLQGPRVQGRIGRGGRHRKADGHPDQSQDHPGGVPDPDPPAGRQVHARTLFLPYQMRGRASLSLARKTSARAREEGAARRRGPRPQAVGREGHRLSKAPLEAAKAELEKLAADPAVQVKPATPSVRPAWSQLVSDRKFKAARKLLDGAGCRRRRGGARGRNRSGLPAYLAEQMIRFRRNLAQVPMLSDLRAMTKSEFEITFTLPAPQEMVVDYPRTTGRAPICPRCRRRGRTRGAVPKLQAMAAAAAALDEGTENPWFRMAEGARLAGRADAAREARRGGDQRPKAAREAALAGGQSVVTAWKDFHARFKRYPILDEHDRAIDAAWAKRPRELAELEKGDPLPRLLRRPGGRDEAPGSGAAAARDGDVVGRDAGIAPAALHPAGRRPVGADVPVGQPVEEVVRATRDDLDKLAACGGAADPDNTARECGRCSTRYGDSETCRAGFSMFPQIR
jgi:hypothetical protein